MPGFDGKQARSITRTPPKYKLFGNISPGQGPGPGEGRVRAAPHATIRRRSQLLAISIIPLDCRKTGVISNDEGQPVISSRPIVKRI
jgi:hypothetical protein